MEKAKHWIGKNKLLCILLGITGILLAPFLWPFILAIVVQALTLALPVAAVLFVLKQPGKKKGAGGKPPSETGSVSVNERKIKREPAENGIYDALVREKGDEPEPVKNESDGKLIQPYTQSRDVSAWYHREGRERILRLKEKADEAGIHAFSVSREGFCVVRANKKYRRIGVIRNFPREGIRKLEQDFLADGMKIRMTGKYIWLSWGEEV